MESVGKDMDPVAEELAFVKKVALVAVVLIVLGLGFVAYALPCLKAYGQPPYAVEGTRAVYRVEAAGVNETYTRIVEVTQANTTHVTLRDRLVHPNGTIIGEETTTIKLDKNTFLPGLPLTEQLYPLGLKTIETPWGPVTAQQYVDLGLGVYYAIDPETMIALVITQAGPLGLINQTLTSVEIPQACPPR